MISNNISSIKFSDYLYTLFILFLIIIQKLRVIISWWIIIIK